MKRFLNVSYRAKVYFKVDIHDPNHPDNLIRKAINKKFHMYPVGTGMSHRKRDISFHFWTRERANEAKELLKSLEIPGLKAKLYNL